MNVAGNASYAAVAKELAAQLHRAEVLGLDRAGLEQVARRARKATGRSKGKSQGKAAAGPGKAEAAAVKKPPSFARHASEPTGAAAAGGPKTVVL